MRRRLPSGPSVSTTLFCAAALALGALAFGCGNTIVVDGDGGSGAAAPDDGWVDDGWADDYSDDGSSSSTGRTCQSYDDQGSAGTVSIHIKNQSSVPIYLPATCGVIDYQLDPASGPDGLSYGPLGGSCLQTCEDLQTEGPVDCAPCAPSVFELQPNASVDVEWTGLALAYDIQMPSECWNDPSFGPSCAQLVMAQMQSYSITMTGYAECAGDCACSDDGICYGDGVGQMAYANPATFDLSSGEVSVVFDFCAFGCPAD